MQEIIDSLMAQDKKIETILSNLKSEEEINIEACILWNKAKTNLEKSIEFLKELLVYV